MNNPQKKKVANSRLKNSTWLLYMVYMLEINISGLWWFAILQGTAHEENVSHVANTRMPQKSDIGCHTNASKDHLQVQP